jgi:hypothetical protein
VTVVEHFDEFVTDVEIKQNGISLSTFIKRICEQQQT